jgi:peptidoglycan/LPS O-acetylase OafA/YrhL
MMAGATAGPVAASTMVRKRPKLPALNGLRVVAALHIYLFHLMQAHQAGLLTFGLLDALPTPLVRLVARGFVSTGLFFQLSGFLLAYAYLGPEGRPKVADRPFWRGRFVRLYPLYFLSLILLIPAPALLPITPRAMTPVQALGNVATNLTLTQAWFPPFAIAWNAPAWALSAFAFFYAVFPGFSRGISRLGPWALRRLLAGLVVAGLVPSLAYLVVDPEGVAWSATSVTVGGTWLNVLRFDPMVWLPQFLAGVVLGRLSGMRADAGLEGRPRSIEIGADLAMVAMVVVLAGVGPIPYVLLRHGLMAPLTLVMLSGLAGGRGLVARALAWPGVARWSEASFGLFALQMPVGVWFAIAALRTPRGSTGHLVAMVGLTLTASVLWAEFVQRPLTDRLRRADLARSEATPASVPGPSGAGREAA